MIEYTPTIGLEIHAELKTATKMFCNSKNDPDEVRPNTHVCPVCLAHPGTLPVVNSEAVRQVLRMGGAVGGSLATYSEFDRKNYFYPDLPKGYQISQYKYPLVQGGSLTGVAITRIHLEEDTANSKHEGEYSVVDYNRAGIPLMELVTEPVIHDAETAVRFAKELQLLLRTLGAGEAHMEKGQMRVEVNISISKTSDFGTKVEVKNLNSFKSVERAIQFEIKRQTALLERGEQVQQETRGFNETTGETFLQRVKESAHDYRYFPDPDIPKFHIQESHALSAQNIHESLPELPWETRERYKAYGLRPDEIETLLSDEQYREFFETEIVGLKKQEEIRSGVNYLLGEVRGSLATQVELRNLAHGRFAEFIHIAMSGLLSSSAAKVVLQEMLKGGESPQSIVDSKGLKQNSDNQELLIIANQIVAENEPIALQFRLGKEESLKYLVGQGMKLSKGSANPELLALALREVLMK